MDDTVVRILFFALACLAIAMVTGAIRAGSASGVVRETLKSFVSLAGGIVLLVVASMLVLSVIQP